MRYTMVGSCLMGGSIIPAGKPRNKAKVSRYLCPVEGCDVTVYVTFDRESGEETVTGFACDRQDNCGIPSFDPCPLYVDLVEKHGIRKAL